MKVLAMVVLGIVLGAVFFRHEPAPRPMTLDQELAAQQRCQWSGHPDGVDAYGRCL